MDDEETLLRRARLRQLIDVCFEAKDVLLLDFIEKKTGKRPNQGELSSLKKDNSGKSFGDKKAKALAGQIGLCRHWFTMPLGANTSPEHWLSEMPTEWSKDPVPLVPNWPILLSSYTQTPSNQAESQNDKHKESAMLLSFSRTSPRSIHAQENYFIPQYDAGGSMGHGLVLPDQPGVIENWSVSREWMNKNVRNITGVDNLCIVTGFGPSMQPMFNPGDPLLVDLGVKSVIADGVYFFRVNDEGFVKQLQKIPTASGMKYVAKSKNPDFDTFEILPEMDFEVIGRVVRVWCGTDF
jgi:hypothetical protein